MEWTSISWGLPDRWNPWNLGHWHRRGLRERDSSGRSQPHLGSHKGSCFLMQNLSEISQKKHQSLFAFLYLNHWSLAHWKRFWFRWCHFEDLCKYPRMRYLQVFFEVEDFACKNLCLWSWLSAMLIPRKLHVTTRLNSSEGLYECMICLQRPVDLLRDSLSAKMRLAWQHEAHYANANLESFLFFFPVCSHCGRFSGGLKVVFPVDLRKISLGAPLDNTSLQVSSLGGCLRVPPNW